MIHKEAWLKEAEEKMQVKDPLFELVQRARDKNNAANERVNELEKAIEKDLEEAEDHTAAPYDRDRIRGDLMKLRKMRDSYPHIRILLGDPDFLQLERKYLG